MADYRLFFLGSDKGIEARHEFSAPDDSAALQIAAVLCDATADSHHGVMLWQGPHRIFEGHTLVDGRRPPAADGATGATLAAEMQQQVVDSEEALLNSHWRLAKSRMLLEKTAALRQALGANTTAG